MPRITLGSALGWIAALGATLALARVAPGAAFSIGIGLSLLAVLCYVPPRSVRGVKLNEAMALLVLLFGLTILSAPSSSQSSCNIPEPGALAREFREPSRVD